MDGICHYHNSSQIKPFIIPRLGFQVSFLWQVSLTHTHTRAWTHTHTHTKTYHLTCHVCCSHYVEHSHSCQIPSQISGHILRCVCSITFKFWVISVAPVTKIKVYRGICAWKILNNFVFQNNSLTLLYWFSYSIWTHQITTSAYYDLFLQWKALYFYDYTG